MWLVSRVPNFSQFHSVPSRTWYFETYALNDHRLTMKTIRYPVYALQLSSWTPSSNFKPFSYFIVIRYFETSALNNPKGPGKLQGQRYPYITVFCEYPMRNKFQSICSTVSCCWFAGHCCVGRVETKSRDQPQTDSCAWHKRNNSTMWCRLLYKYEMAGYRKSGR